MGNLAVDTAVEPVADGTFVAHLSDEWEIWGPMGGYVAACGLRAIGASVPELRPATFSCHYLGVARFAPVDIRVETRKGGRTATSLRVEISQEGRPILEGISWAVAENEGLEHDESMMPEVPRPEDLADIRDLVPDDEPPFAFWRNLDARPIDFESTWPPEGPRPAVWREWLRFAPEATFQDPWADAARSVVLVDLPSWPAAHRPHAWRQPAFTAPTLDLNVAFHRSTSDQDWLLCDGAAPVSTEGLFGWTARVWSPGGLLHASGGGQCLYRRMPAPG